MKILIYSINYSPELTGIGKYNGELAPFIAEKGLEVHVLTAPPYYPEWKRHQGYKNKYSTNIVNDSFRLYRCPVYVPKKVTTIARLLHLCSFAFSSALRLITLFKLKPDVVFLVQPTLFCAPAALLYCKLTGAKAVMHIQDFEVDAMLGLGLGKGSKLKRFAKRVEAWLMNKFDLVSSISYSMLDNAKAKGVEPSKLLYFPNWADTDFVTPDISGDDIREQWGYTSANKIVLYSGNIGQKQGLEILLDAALELITHSEVKFLVIGSGAYSATLQKMAHERELTNIRFLPLQAWELVPQILAMADVHLVIQKRGAADAVLPSKLTNVLSAGGHALITTDPETELGRIAVKYPGIYHCVEPENSTAFIAKLVKCLELNTREINGVARVYALENLNKDKVINRFIENLQQTIKS